MASNLLSFPLFADLPTEVRLRVWHFAAPCRPRVIQVAYDPKQNCWKAWKDGLGGLPSIVHVSREAREESLKPYTRIFDAYVDPEEDIIFISDPIFSIRKPRSVFMSSQYANVLRKIAITSEIYNGLAQSFDQFPRLCHAPATILRKLQGLTYFALALSEDGAGFEYSSDEWNEHGEDRAEEDEDEGVDRVAGWDVTAQPQHDGSSTVEDNEDRDLDDEEELENSLGEHTLVRRFLDRLDEEAMETMSKGYFRHLGNIHFESAVGHPDHWEAWEIYRDELEASCKQEKDKYPDWVRPKVSVVAVEYGLNRLGDFRTQLHLLGDHTDDVLETIADGHTNDNEGGDEI